MTAPTPFPDDELKLTALLLIAAGATTACASTSVLPDSGETTFPATDGGSVVADVHRAIAGPSAPLLILFHQGGGDVRGEYGPIVPRLTGEGYHVLAVDLREGGDLFGSTNRTLALRGGRGSGYCGAYPDVEGALDHARAVGFDGPIVVWGSSFSGALALRLASERGDELAGVVAFSPAGGPPMQGCMADDFAPGVSVPTLCVRPASEAARESVIAQTERFRGFGFETYVADPGVHGSSSLVPDRVEGDTEATWERTLRFLADVTTP